MSEDKKKLNGFTINNTHPTLIPKIIRQVKVGDLVGVVLNNASEDDSKFRGDFYSGFVHLIGCEPEFPISLRRGHPLNNSSAIKEYPALETTIKAREIA